MTTLTIVFVFNRPPYHFLPMFNLVLMRGRRYRSFNVLTRNIRRESARLDWQVCSRERFATAFSTFVSPTLILVTEKSPTTFIICPNHFSQSGFRLVTRNG